MSFLLAITINPVQSYIAESRKLMDLKNSSRIISDIMKKFREKIDGELIYPNIDKGKEIDYSNTLVFEVNEIKTREEMNKLKDGIFEEIGNPNLSEVFNCFWGFEEIKENDYNKAYKDLMRKFKSIKNTYEFVQKVENEIDEKVKNSEKRNHKCSLCGKRNVSSTSTQNSDEELCELCLFKRNYSKEHIESVYDIAVKQWRKKYEKELKSLPNNYTIPSQYYNINKVKMIMDLLETYDTNINDEKNKKNKQKLLEIQEEFIQTGNPNFDIFNSICLKSVLFKLLDFLSNTSKHENKIDSEYKELSENQDCKKEIKAPTYQYAFYQFDIDSLGKWMAGEFFDNKEKLKENQQKLSELLINFAVELKSKLDKNVTVIYLGGDDFLGVMPIENIKETWKIVDKVFEEEVIKKTNYNNIMTYSTSITIASCGDPAAYALNVTRKELERVKARHEEPYDDNTPSKNGVSINYLINAGKEITAYFRKEDFNEFLNILKILKPLYESNKLSYSFIKNFQNEFKNFNFDDLSQDDYNALGNVMNIEFKRIVQRSMKVENNELLNGLSSFFDNLFVKNNYELKSNHNFIDITNIKNTLNLIPKISDIEFSEVQQDAVNED